MRQDVFESIVALEKNESFQSFKPEAKRFIERNIKLGKRNGMNFDLCFYRYMYWERCLMYKLSHRQVNRFEFLKLKIKKLYS